MTDNRQLARLFPNEMRAANRHNFGRNMLRAARWTSPAYVGALTLRNLVDYTRQVLSNFNYQPIKTGEWFDLFRRPLKRLANRENGVVRKRAKLSEPTKQKMVRRKVTKRTKRPYKRRRMVNVRGKGFVRRWRRGRKGRYLKYWRKRFFTQSMPLRHYFVDRYELLPNWDLPVGSTYHASAHWKADNAWFSSLLDLIKEPAQFSKRHIYMKSITSDVFMLNQTGVPLKCEVTCWRCHDKEIADSLAGRLYERDPQWSRIFDTSFQIKAKLLKKLVFSVEPGQQMKWSVTMPIKTMMTKYHNKEQSIIHTRMPVYMMYFRVYSDAVTQYSTQATEDGKFGFVGLTDTSFRLRNRWHVKFSCNREAISMNLLQQDPQGFAKPTDESFIGLVPDFKVKTEDKLVEN